MAKFDYAKHVQFNADLGVLIQGYLDQDDVDAMALAGHLNRRAHQMEIIGVEERRKFFAERDAKK